MSSLIGNKPNQVPRNGDLGSLAFTDEVDLNQDVFGLLSPDNGGTGVNNSLYPNVKPSLLLDFANSKSLDPRITFTRASTATRINEKGLIESVASGQPRFDHDPVTGECKGLLIEEQRTNLLTYSEQFDNTAWSKLNATVIPNATIAPDGTLTADKLVEGVANALHYVFNGVASLASGNITISVFCKSGERSIASIQTGGLGWTTTASCIVDLSSGTVLSGTANVTNVGSGWYRVAITGVSNGDASTRGILVTPCNVSAATSYTGDGTSGLYIWGAQLEAGNFSTSYIPTTSAQVTRLADLASITGTNFSQWYRQDEGTVFVKHTQNPLSTNFILTIDRGSTWSPRLQLNTSSSLLHYEFNNVNDSSTVDCQLSKLVSLGNMTALSYKQNNYAYSRGDTVITNTSVSVPTGLTRMTIGQSPVNSLQLNGHISKLAYYPKRLSNTELQTLSQD